jgi:hypothetical protein
VEGDQIIHLKGFGVADVAASETITVRQLLYQDSGLPKPIGQQQSANIDLSDFAIENSARALADVGLNAATSPALAVAVRPIGQ